jgi:uncharacterized protein YneR
MNISITRAAFHWFTNELDLQPGDQVKFYPQIYGTSPIQPGFALAFAVDNTSADIAVRTEIEGITFLVEEVHLWFFNGHSMEVDYNDDLGEITFSYSL